MCERECDSDLEMGQGLDRFIQFGGSISKTVLMKTVSAPNSRSYEKQSLSVDLDPCSCGCSKE